MYMYCTSWRHFLGGQKANQVSRRSEHFEILTVLPTECLETMIDSLKWTFFSNQVKNELVVACGSKISWGQRTKKKHLESSDASNNMHLHQPKWLEGENL